MPAATIEPPTRNHDAQYVIDEITAACNSIGKLDENDGTYMKDRDCKPCLKEVLRFLNTDTSKHLARTTLGAMNIVKSDLIPLMVQYCDFNDGDPDLFTTILRLCTNLTSSIFLLFENQEIPTDQESQPLVTKLLNSLYAYKEAFAQSDKVWSLLNTYLRHSQEDEIMFERLIILIRNILHIPVDSRADMGIHCDFDSHDMCIYQMERCGMLETFIDIASSSERGAEFCFHIMEIIYLILRNQNPSVIAFAKPPGQVNAKLDKNDSDKKRLAESLAKERREQAVSQKKFAPPRFKNTLFVAKNFKSLGEAPLIVNKPIDSRELIKFDAKKTELRKSKLKKPLNSETSMLISDKNTKCTRVAYGLRTFCYRFVEKVYSNYMQQIKHNLIQKRAQDNDESYYLWSIQFFTAFNRLLNLSIDNISETISISTLHFIQILVSTYQEKLKMEKKKFKDISKRLHLAIRAYMEILLLIESVQPDSPLYDVIKGIQKTVFTNLEYSTLLVELLQNYDEPKHSAHYLRDLIKANHIFINLMEKYGPEETKHFITRYCCPEVIKTYLDALKEHRSNEESTNLEILRLYERIAYDCHYEMLLAQASLFKCLLEVMPVNERFGALAKHLIQAFGELTNKRRWLFQELLFWKTSGDAREIDCIINPQSVPSPSGSPIRAGDGNEMANETDNVEGTNEPHGIDNELDKELMLSDDSGFTPPPDPTSDLADFLNMGDDSDEGDIDNGNDDEVLEPTQNSPRAKSRTSSSSSDSDKLPNFDNLNESNDNSDDSADEEKPPSPSLASSQSSSSESEVEGSSGEVQNESFNAEATGDVDRRNEAIIPHRLESDSEDELVENTSKVTDLEKAEKNRNNLLESDESDD